MVLKSEASSTLALKKDSTDIPSWNSDGAVTMSSVAGEALSVLSNAVPSGTGALSITGGASTTSTTGVGGALTLSGGAGGWRPVAPVVP